MEQYETNCCVCNAIVDTREIEDGGSLDGAELSDNIWVCSAKCWYAAADILDDAQIK